MMRFRCGRGTRQASLIVLIGLGALPGGCSGVGSDDGTAGLSCVDDTKACIERRQAALKTLLADKERKWVRDPATPETHASGVRLFAYLGKKRELTCTELAMARREVDGVPQALKGAGGQGLSAAQISRTIMLAAEVGKELAAEMRRRCKT
jgi:hypothetical protein